MRLHKKCCRCNMSFLATANMLVCGPCYGNPEDIALSEFIQAYPDVSFNPSLKRIEKIISKLENNTCINDKNMS